jgi:hypothetical protein
LLSAALAATCFSVPLEAQKPGPAQVNKIVDQALNQSQVMETAAYLTDRIGARLPNSPQMRQAEAWAQQRFRSWGLQNVRAEPFSFGRGWSISSSSARMTAPRVLELRSIPIAWTPSTNGTITAPIIVAPIAREADFAAWRGKLAGKIVLISAPGTVSEPTDPPFTRYSQEALAKLDTFQQPTHSPRADSAIWEELAFPRKLDLFLKAEGAAASVQKSRRDGGLLHGEGYGHKLGQTPSVPAVEMAAEDYRRLVRLAVAGPPPVLELNNDVRFHDEDPNAYNILADIPGTDKVAGYVMAGGHFDSWVAGDGAADNAAGAAIVMEAARILARLGARPRRTIRFALWNAEEQGLLGSFAYVDRYIASRPKEADLERSRSFATDFFGWRHRWPIALKPGYRELAAYFNMDTGSGRIRGIYVDTNLAAVPLLKEWLAPFASMGATTIAAAPTHSTDHYFMQQLGLPAFQFIQDRLDYESRVVHSNIDTYDHLKAEDMRQAALILASLLWSAANSTETLPRMPLPQPPRATDPFGSPANK